MQLEQGGRRTGPDESGDLEDPPNRVGQAAERQSAAGRLKLLPQTEKRPEVGAGEILDVLQVDDHLVGAGVGDGGLHLFDDALGHCIPLQSGGAES